MKVIFNLNLDHWWNKRVLGKLISKSSRELLKQETNQTEVIIMAIIATLYTAVLLIAVYQEKGNDHTAELVGK